jgi:hypothetical protein
MRYAHSLADAGIAASMGNVVAIRTLGGLFQSSTAIRADRLRAAGVV